MFLKETIERERAISVEKTRIMERARESEETKVKERQDGRCLYIGPMCSTVAYVTCPAIRAVTHRVAAFHITCGRKSRGGAGFGEPASPALPLCCGSP